VVIDGVGVAAEQLITHQKTTLALPCASSTSKDWYFASGSTAGPSSATNQLLVSLYNPLPTTAVADLAFATDSGQVLPPDDQGISVPPRSQVVVDVGAHVQQRHLIATTVHARLGRLVATESQLAPALPSGVTAVLGSSATRQRWGFPAGQVGHGAREWLDIYNPSKRTAAVQVSLALSFGSASPVTVSVGPESVLQLDVSKQLRVPERSLFGLQVRSVNGVGVVAERVFLDQAPQADRGLSYTMGALPSTDWAVASGEPAHSSELVVVMNPGRLPSR
jgi:hypothetical protein